MPIRQNSNLLIGTVRKIPVHQFQFAASIPMPSLAAARTAGLRIHALGTEDCGADFALSLNLAIGPKSVLSQKSLMFSQSGCHT
jgi:hypothetical protein